MLTVDEDRAQTRAIHDQQRQRETLDGLVADQRRRGVLKVHQDAQRLLEPLAVVNPFAPALAFSDALTRTRRDHIKYLTLIRAITLLHQHQRPRRSASVDGRQVVYIEATAQDVRLANRLAHRVLGRSLDELAPGARRLLGLIEQLVDGQAGQEDVARERVRFTRRELREQLGLGDTQLKVHLARLVSMELVHVGRGPHGVSVYELAFDTDEAEAAGGTLLPGLIDPDQHTYDTDRSGPQTDRSGAGRPPVGPWSGPGRTAENGHDPSGQAESEPPTATEARNGLLPASSSAAVVAVADQWAAG